jgi:DNA-binding winged helix-turn-helix (wHTH) protein
VGIRFGEFVLDSGAKQLTRGGTPVALSPKALQLLELLIEARPNVVSKERIIETLWPDVVVEEANVRNLIAELRGALGDDDRGPRSIRTAHRLGYAFIAPVGATRRRTGRLVDGIHAYFVADGVNTIGRDPASSIPLVTTGVSRRHAQIIATADRFVLEDLASKNGTWLNEARVDGPVELHEGDEIRIGMVSLVFRLTDEDTTATISGI